MCVAVPGKLISVTDGFAPGAVDRMGTVDFQGSRVDVGLAFVPEAGVGDWVLVHAGFALSVLDEAEARQTWDYLRELGPVELPAPSQSKGITADQRATV